MQFSLAFLALAASSLVAAQLPPVPQCSLNCFSSALTSDGCSGLTDFKCHCQKPALKQKITPCVKEACSKADQSKVSNVVVSVCKSVGEPIQLPPV
ncbi:hypothetical protein FQN54_003839 [Arachnomyces sp. PD_36]|nr:hypothetical protein FQN54_003839 [Arachnomyces sp. PD_36]